ncbi:hypothetical protein J1N35_001661 [Gossypium stocksii]|uniref:Uncharacterized protein n=1 Tax=Gossypium stocksii TaxID=47602 RepID=A0A9D3WKC2_9ROSI|nr:hypothetical protein J1N35_001661 [Gossypium stocksii]
MDKVNKLFNSHRDKLLERNNAHDAMLMALKEETMAMTMALNTRIEELEKCLKKSVIEKDDGADKEPKKLGSSKGKAKAKRAKRRKKKRVKCFLCHGPHELQNCPEQAVVKRKAVSKLGESSERLPPKEEMGLSSNLGENIVMNTVKLEPMWLNSSEASELAESSTKLPPIREVSGASGFKEKEVMQVGQLTRVNATSRMVRVKKQRRSSKLMTITPNTSDGGLLCRWGSFGQFFSKLFEKSVRLKPGWPDNEDMAT